MNGILGKAALDITRVMGNARSVSFPISLFLVLIVECVFYSVASC